MALSLENFFYYNTSYLLCILSFYDIIIYIRYKAILIKNNIDIRYKQGGKNND